MKIAIIPARGGSKSIPKKNLALVGEKSLLERAIISARLAEIKHIYVSTDDKEIAAEAIRVGAEVIIRPTEISGDASSSEAALLHAISRIDKNVCVPESKIAFLQATSPFTKPQDLFESLEQITEGVSLFSAVEFHNFLWVKSDTGWLPKGHDSNFRKMKEDLEHTAVETGNFYCFSAKNFIEEKSRFCGRVFPFFVDPATTFQIDSQAELKAAQKMAEALDKI